MRQVVTACALIFLLAFAMQTVAEKSVQAAASYYSGNVRTGKYHNSRCTYFSCKNCTARFSSSAEARSHGYVACKKCGG